MRRKYRSQTGIILDILEALEQQSLPATRLATKTNLPYDRLQVTINKLYEQGLVDKVSIKGERATYYTITREGYKALEKLRETKRLLEAMGYKL